MSDRSGQRQCRRGVSGDVELDAAMALANMAGVSGPAALPAVHPAAPQHGGSREEEEELASTRLSLELGKVGIQASSCSSGSSAGCPSRQTRVPVAAPGGGGYGPRPRHTLTEAEKEAKRLRRVLANRESARQTILRRQAVRDELARKVADLSSQNESMKKEKETVMQEYLTLQETNKQLKEQVIHVCTRWLRTWSILQKPEDRDIFMMASTRLERTAREVFYPHGWRCDLRIGFTAP
ncbi:hypothetical protein VPH35_096796 [Triticum aestivum]